MIPATSADRPRTSQPAWRLCLLAAPYVIVVGALLARFLFNGRPWAGAFTLVALITCGSAGLAYSVGAAVHPAQSAAARRPWRYLAGYFVLTFIYGMSTTAWIADGYPEVTPTFLVAAAARLLTVPVLLFALMSFAAEPLSDPARRKIALDVTTVVGGGLMVAWYFIVGPALSSATDRGPAVAASVVYGVADLVVLVGIGTVLLRGARGAARGSVWLLLAGALAHLGMDTYHAYQALHQAHPASSNAWQDLVVVTPLALMLAASIEQYRRVEVPTPAGGTPTLATLPWLPTAVLGLGFGLLGYAAARAGLVPWGGLVASAAIMTAGVAGRQLVDLREKQGLVLTDSLTGLGNRVRLRNNLQKAIQGTRRSGRHVAVLICDLDGFKQINDRLGHDVGDAMLMEFADVLRRNTRQSDTAARLGGDEFAVILHPVDNAQDAVIVAQRILADLTRNITLGGEDLQLRASIGLAVHPIAPTDHATALAEQLIRHADTAMYIAKRRRSNDWQLHTEEAMTSEGTSAGAKEPPIALTGRCELVDNDRR